jgi:phosphate transport system substrate-binding protein
MILMNEALKKRFQDKFPGSAVNLAAIGTDEALKALLDGKVNLVAVGRRLTPAEKAKGLTEAPLSREKVAIIVGSNNSFKKSITFDQFAKIYRGEITDWSQLGGAPGSIRVVDRPDSSDTRRALNQYTVFQQKPFKTGSNAIQVTEDSTAAVIKELGNDGIGYAIADQVIDQPTVNVLPLHETLPSDPRYPFSQPRGYVYQGEPGPATLAFLGIAVSKPGQEAIQAAQPAEAKPAGGAIGSANPTASSTVEPSTSISAAVEPTATESPTVAATAETQAAAPSAVVATEARPFPWWWLLLPLAGLAGLLAAMRGRFSAVPVAAPIAAVDRDRSRIILTPRNCRDAYAYWEISDQDQAAFDSQSGRNLGLRLYDVTNIDLNQQSAHSVKQFDVRKNEPDHHLPIALDDRDYVAELGYVAENGSWLKVARSESVRVPACTPAEKIGSAATAAAATVAIPEVTTAAIASGAGAAAAATKLSIGNSVAPTPGFVSDFSSRLENAAGKASETASNLMGNATQTASNWTGEVTNVAGSALAGGAAAAVGVGAIAQSFFNKAGSTVEGDRAATDTSAFAPDCRIILVPRTSDQAYAYWEVTHSYKEPLRQQGGKQLTLRIHDVTNIDIDYQPPHSTQEYSCLETDQDKHVPIPTGGSSYENLGYRDYLAELGYFTDDKHWLKIIRSLHVRIPENS